MSVNPLVCLAGAPGIEPGNVGIKIRCLTAWRRPIMHLVLCTLAIIKIEGYSVSATAPNQLFPLVRVNLACSAQSLAAKSPKTVGPLPDIMTPNAPC